MPSSESPPPSTQAAPAPKQQRIAEKTPPWSESLQQQTRAAIADLSIPPDGVLHMKHKVLGFAAMDVLEILQGQLVCRSKSGESWEYPDVEALLFAGWAID